MQFMVILAGVPGSFDTLDEDRQEQVRDRHQAFQAHLRKKGRYVFAARLETAKTARTMARSGADISVMDGPFAETKEQVLGTYIFEADDMNMALEDCALLVDDMARLEIRPVAWSG